MEHGIAEAHSEAEWTALRAELEEAREVLRALHAGEVDAIVVRGPEGDQIFTLSGAEHPYRVLVEHMSEGAATLAEDGTVIYCNAGFAQIARASIDRLIGCTLVDFFAPVDRPQFYAWLEQGRREGAKREFTLVTESGSLVPVYLSGSPTELPNAPGICLVATDMSEVRARAAELTQVNAALEVEVEERRRAEDQLLRSLEEKETLLQEIHHRVRNNLQVVCSLLALQAASVAEPVVQRLLLDSENRVRSIALVHEKLYGPANPGRVEMKEYFRGITDHVLRTYGALAEGVRLNLEVGPVVLELSRAVPCGLIVNELVSNALEHAFAGCAGGEIDVRLTSVGPRLCLAVRDNGVGLPDGLERGGGEGLGLRLAGMLAAQLEGALVIERSGGTSVTISFPERAPLGK